MAIGPNFHSDDELIKRLQIVARDVRATGGDLVRADADLREVRNLIAEMAGRIYADPGKWGIAGLSEGLRDDAAADTLMLLLTSIPAYRAQQPLAKWFASAVDDRFQELWTVHEQQARARGPQRNGKAGRDREDAAPPSVFTNGLWAKFEQEFPRDAFALRLRYMLKRSPEDMALMLDAPSPRAVSMRLNRARDRFKSFCEQSGSDVRATEQMLHELGEGRKR